MLNGTWAHLGVVEGDNSSKAIGHVPHVAPMAYLAQIYEPLREDQIPEIFEQLGVSPPQEYLEFLMIHNGMRFGHLSLNGHVVLIDRTISEIGQPVSLLYGNLYGKRDYLPKSHFGIGVMNGNWYSQGELYLTSDRTVEMYLKEENILGYVWESFTDFLMSETQRQIALHDENGSIRKNVHHLPGDTLTWEAIAKAKSEAR